MSFSVCQCIDHDLNFSKIYSKELNENRCNSNCNDCWKEYCGMCSFGNHCKDIDMEYILKYKTKEQIEKLFNLL